MATKESATIIELKAALKEIKDKNLLPRGYGQIVADRLGVKRNDVYQVVLGNRVKLDIIKEVLKVAADNEELDLLREANRILGKGSEKKKA